MTDSTGMSPVEQVYTLLGLTETNGGVDLVPPADVERAITLYPQNLKYAAANIAFGLANAAAIASDPQQFSLQGVMSVSFHDPAAHWRSVGNVLLKMADSDYKRDRKPINVVFTEMRNRHEVEEDYDYAPPRRKGHRL